MQKIEIKCRWALAVFLSIALVSCLAASDPHNAKQGTPLAIPDPATVWKPEKAKAWAQAVLKLEKRLNAEFAGLRPDHWKANDTHQAEAISAFTRVVKASQHMLAIYIADAGYMVDSPSDPC